MIINKIIEILVLKWFIDYNGFVFQIIRKQSGPFPVIIMTNHCNYVSFLLPELIDDFQIAVSESFPLTGFGHMRSL